MLVYENKSKKLIEDYDKYFQKLGAPSLLDQIDSPEPIELEAILTWRSSSKVGAKQLSRFEIHAHRPVGEAEFVDRSVRGSFLLSAKIDLQLPSKVCPVKISGIFVRAGEALLIRRMTVIEPGEHPDLDAKVEALKEPQSVMSERFGELTFVIESKEFKGEFKDVDRMVSVNFIDTSPDQIAGQIAKLSAYFDQDRAFETQCVEVLEEHAKFREHVHPGAQIRLSGLRLDSNLLFASFHAPGVNFANVVGVWRNGRFEDPRVDEVSTARF